MEISVEPDSDSSGEENSIERSTILPTELEPKDLYILRPFPTLIGSATFYETDHLGLRLEDSSASEYGSDASESEGESSGTETEVRMRVKPVAGGGLAEDVDGSSGDLFSEGEAHATTHNAVREDNGSPAPGEETRKIGGKFSRNNHKNSPDEGNLFGSSSEEDLFSEAPKKERKEVKQIEKPVSEETAEIVPTATTSKEPRKKKFKKKLPPGAVPVFAILDSEDSDDDESEEGGKSTDFSQSSRSTTSGITANKKPEDLGIFGGDSGSDDDLFSPDKPKEKSKAETTKPIEDKPAPEASASTPAKTRFGGGESNFDSGSEDDLFEASSTSKNTLKSEEKTVVRKPIGGVQLFSGLDQAAILGKRTNQASNREETTSPIIPVKSAVMNSATSLSGKQKEVSLYDNSSSDDDLFTSMSKAAEPSQSARVEQTDKPQQSGKSTPVISNANTKPVNSNQLDLFISSGEDSGDDLFSKPKSAAPAIDTVAPRTVKPASPLPEANPSPQPVMNAAPSKAQPNSNESPITEKDSLNNNVPSKQTADQKRTPGGLFQVDSDEDEDDDLFSIIANKPIQTEPKSVPSAPEPSEPLSAGGVGASDLFSENDELFSAIQSLPVSSIVPPANPPNKPIPVPALFSATDQYDGDLFDSPASLNLFVTPNPPSPPTLKNTKADGGLFAQASPPPIDTTPPPSSLLPSLTALRPKNPGRRPPSQRNRQERAENASIETLLAPTAGVGSGVETAEDTQTNKPHKALPDAQSGPGKNKDFLKELNKAMGKGMIPGEPALRKKSAQAAPVLFDQTGDISPSSRPKDIPNGAERGAARMDALYTPEEPSKLVGVTKNRPKPPGKRPPNRTARISNIPSSTEEFGNFYAEPLAAPTPNASRQYTQLFNGGLEDGGDLFALPSSTRLAGRSKLQTNILAEEDNQFGNFSQFPKQGENNIEDILFPNSREPAPTSKQDNQINSPILPAVNREQNATFLPQDLPDDLFSSIALPKATKSSRVATKERKNASTPISDREDPLSSKPSGNDPLTIDSNRDDTIDDNDTAVRVDRLQRHKLVKQTDNELFGGEDDLFDTLPESQLKAKGERTKKKRATEANKKTKKPKKEIDPNTVDDLFA